MTLEPMDEAQKGSVAAAANWLTQSLVHDDAALVRLARTQLEAVFPTDAERRFPGDAVEQLIYNTLCDRGNSPDAAAQAIEDAYDYEPFGRLVDSIENAIPEEATT